MNQSKIIKWFKIFYHLSIFGIVTLLILATIALMLMLIDDLNLASIIIILLVAILMVFLFKNIH